MQIDRRIINGLAWAGAALVVLVPAADYVSRALKAPAPQLAVVQEEEPAPALVAPPATTPAKPEVAVSAPAPAPAPVESRPAAEPAVAAAAPTERVAGGSAVDTYLQSGRKLPSYISDSAATSAATPAVAPSAPTVTPPPVAATPAAPAETPRVETAALPQKIAPVPMPLSMRPRSVERPVVVATPPAVEAPLIIETPQQPVVTADDLRDWESGPLADFLAQRGQGPREVVVPEDYDPDGFFLDQGPNNSQARFQRFPRAYEGDGFYFYDR